MHAEERPSSPVPVLRKGPYVIFGEIGAGGMATVHGGLHVAPGGFVRQVAVKRLRPQFASDRDFVATFIDEARLTSRIHHPNVVSTLDVVSDGEILLVTDYVAGVSLAHLLRCREGRRPAIPPPILVSILRGVLYGLHAAHEARAADGTPLCIIHRDVSPQNVLVGSDGVARLVDFGIAKAVARVQVTREGQLKGKLPYMAPEQLRGVPLDRRVDIYASAAVLWEGLTGVRVFRSEDKEVLVRKILLGRVDPPTRIVEGLDPALDEIVHRGLAVDREHRYASAREMAAALERLDTAGVGEVAKWVATLASDVLEERAATMRAIEQAATAATGTSTPEAHPTGKPMLGTPDPTALRPPIALLAGVGVALSCVVLCAGALFWHHRVDERPPPADDALASPEQLLPEQPSSSGDNTTEEPAETPSAAAMTVHRHRIPSFTPRHPSRRSPQCDPPYLIDSSGLRHVKRECL